MIFNRVPKDICNMCARQTKDELNNFKENSSTIMVGLAARISALETDNILLKHYNGLSLVELQRLYDLVGFIGSVSYCYKIAIPEMIDGVKFAVFEESIYFAAFPSGPKPDNFTLIKKKWIEPVKDNNN